jgi:thioredoxin-like negative regulator of GroEL
LDPHDSMAAEFLAAAELKAGRFDRFDAVLRQAADHHSVNGEMASLAANRLARLGRMAEALDLAKRTALGAPDDEVIARTWLNLAYTSKQPAEVVAAAACYLRDNPGDPQAHLMMADALNYLGQTNAAALHLSIVHATPF